jgi:hypothetical protein
MDTTPIGAAAHKNKGRRHRQQREVVMPEAYRQKIKVGLHLRDLGRVALGTLEVSPVRLKAIEILLRKVLPDLAPQEHAGSLQRQIVIVSGVIRALAAPDAQIVEHNAQQSPAEPDADPAAAAPADAPAE